MKKTIIATICGVVAAAVIIAGVIISFTKMNESESIGAGTALNIAINDAGINKNEIINSKTEFERNNGKYIFDVEFYSAGIEYEYYIDAKTGVIIKAENEKGKKQIKEQKQTTKQTSSAQTTALTTQTGEKYIGLEAAKQIALDNAKVSVNDAVFRKAKIDYENKKAIYEIKFTYGSTEYEYEIDAQSGTIIDYEIEDKD